MKKMEVGVGDYGYGLRNMKEEQGRWGLLQIMRIDLTKIFD